MDPSFVLNLSPFDRGSVLVAGPDFGTGSSCEHAVWALMDYGFRVVISSRFADVFRGNAGKAGLLAAEVAQDDDEFLWKLIEQNPGLEITVNIQDRNITAGTVVAPFMIDDYTAWRLLEGPRRYRPYAAETPRDRSLRGIPPELEAAHYAGLLTSVASRIRVLCGGFADHRITAPGRQADC